MQRKRGKVPGTPGMALASGRGVLAMSDVTVTWVCTDVASSTLLWVGGLSFIAQQAALLYLKFLGGLDPDHSLQPNMLNCFVFCLLFTQHMRLV